MGATIYCLCNQKGGCSKTMSSVSLGVGLAREGKKVLLVDVDSLCRIRHNGSVSTIKVLYPNSANFHPK